MACLADTDGPCLITAAQSGAEWGYSLLSLQIALVPILYMAQELTARLGIVREAGMTAMLRLEIGPICAWAVSLPLLTTCILGLVSEFSIIGQTMAFWGVPVWQSNAVVSGTLLAIVATGSYSVAEWAGLILGSCQVAFFFTMLAAGAKTSDVIRDSVDFPLEQRGFVKLVTANIGAVIMPWMLAYQQSAICNKGLHDDTAHVQLFLSRLDTALGCFITQGVMAAMLITVAAVQPKGQSVDNLPALLAVFTEVLHSEFAAKMLMTFAIIGACMVAAIVQSLCAAWTFEQALGRATATLAHAGDGHHSSRFAAGITNIGARPTFYAVYAIVCCGSFVFTLLAENAVDLSVWTEFCNGVLMPPVVISLWYLSAYTLPAEFRLQGMYKWITLVVFLLCSCFCVGSILFSFGS